MSESKEIMEQLPQISTDKPTPHRSAEKIEKRRLEKSFRLALAGVISGFWSLGTVIQYTKFLEPDQHSSTAIQRSIDLTGPTLDISINQHFHPTSSLISERPLFPPPQPKGEKIKEVSGEQRETESQGAIETVFIPPRTLQVDQLDQTVSSLETSQIHLQEQLNQFTIELNQAKEEFSNTDSQAIAQFEEAKTGEINALNQLRASLRETKIQAENQQQEFKKRADEDRKILRSQSDSAQEEFTKARNPEKTERDRIQKTAEDVSVDLTNRLESDKEHTLLDRANQEVAQARNLLEQVTPEERERFQKNLNLAEEQQLYVNQHVQSLSVDTQLIKAALSEDRLIYASDLVNFQKRALERPELSVKFWELEAERAQLGLDPDKAEETPQGKEYLEWIQNELKTALAQKDHYQNPQAFDQTTEGQLLYANKDQIDAWLKISATAELFFKHNHLIDEQHDVFSRMLKDMDKELKALMRFFKGNNQKLAWSQSQLLAKTFKLGALKRAMSLKEFYTHEIGRLELFGESKASDIENTKQTQLLLDRNLGQLINGNEEDFTDSKNSDQALEQFVTKVDDDRFSQTPEAIFLNANQNRLQKNPVPRTDTLEEQITNADLNSRSSKVEAGELREIKEYFLNMPPEIQQRIKTISIDGGANRWATLGKDDIELNIFGNVPVERQRRLILALDQLKARVENRPQNTWAKERIASLEQLYPLTEDGRAWLETVQVEQLVGRATDRYAVNLAGRVIFAPGAQINGIISEVGHVIFGRHPWRVRDRPDLSWTDGDPDQLFNFRKNADRRAMPSAFREWNIRLDTFTAQTDAGDAEPLRRWLIQSWPYPTDSYHHAQMNIPWAMGGGIIFLKDTPFADYFDQFLAEGDYKSWGELGSWYFGLSKENQEFVEAYTDDHDNLFPIIKQLAQERPSFLVPLSEQRIAELNAVLAKKKVVIEKEWQQELLDFGDQFPLYERFIDYPTQEWLKYQSRIFHFHQKYPDLLRQSHPTAYKYLTQLSKTS